MLSKFFRNHNYKVVNDNPNFYRRIVSRAEVLNNVHSINSAVVQEKHFLESPKFPNHRINTTPSNIEDKKKIKGSCIDFFSKGEYENNSSNHHLVLNKSKETISDLDKTPDFNMLESMGYSTNTLLHSIHYTHNQSDDGKKRNSLHDMKGKNNLIVVNKIDLKKNSNKKDVTNSLKDQIISIQNFSNFNTKLNNSANTEEEN